MTVYPIWTYFRGFGEIGVFRRRKSMGPAPNIAAVRAMDNKAETKSIGIAYSPISIYGYSPSFFRTTEKNAIRNGAKTKIKKTTNWI